MVRLSRCYEPAVRKIRWCGLAAFSRFQRIMWCSFVAGLRLRRDSAKKSSSQLAHFVSNMQMSENNALTHLHSMLQINSLQV